MDSLNQIDVTLFKMFAGNHQSWSILVLFSIFCAKFLIYVIPLHLCVLWFYGRERERCGVLSICVSICVALFIGYLISLFYFQPRPFVVGLTTPLIQHRATASFPSNHALTIAAYTAGFYFYQYKVAFRFAMIFLCLICWARVFVGVHYPFDILAGIILGSFISLGVIQFIAPYFPRFLYQIPPLKYNFKRKFRFK
ncbi:undecaprenyl-diphosphatase [Bartonella fuyuanensis]|uniref:Undecaprenyl-diphosphatase n=1 Tax=Bartonella fuyuanensis TaxID=1460968 RepID=A0A840DZQ1_9HYPH|nr:undecaprenyl-diphosphatase [Bartonella fuyuanensis]MBB4076087.1 undecaprenyl-diphosphatase [Bartonella fuyuanensis]